MDIGALVTEVLQIMQPRAERAGVALRAVAGPGLVVGGDRDRLKQALLNLLDNALTWTPPRGSVSVAAERDGDVVCIGVQDSGPGIAPELRERVWERGVSASGGQGLGLALVRDVVTAHGGSAILRNGTGTTVELRLPLLIEAQPRRDRRL